MSAPSWGKAMFCRRPQTQPCRTCSPYSGLEAEKEIKKRKSNVKLQAQGLLKILELPAFWIYSSKFDYVSYIQCQMTNVYVLTFNNCSHRAVRVQLPEVDGVDKRDVVGGVPVQAVMLMEAINNWVVIIKDYL